MRYELATELQSPELEAVVAALERLLESAAVSPSAWWEAGALGDGAAAEEPWGEAGVIEP